MTEKAARKLVNSQGIASRRAAVDKLANAGALKQTKAGAKRAAAARARASAAPATALGKLGIKKMQGLLRSKRPDSVSLGLSLLELLGATQADYEAVFTEAVIRSVLNRCGWVGESWIAVAKALLPYGAVSELFQRVAEEKYFKRPRRFTDFDGFTHARAAATRPAFLTARGQSTLPQKPFIDLVEILAGSFTMGSPDNEPGARTDENQVEVRITMPYAIGRTVVTQAQWRAVIGTEPWRYAGLADHQSGDDFPAVYVTWDDAVLFCQTLTELERETGWLTATQSYRLPTEAEWEYACRAGTTTAYSFGNDPEKLCEYGWYKNNSGGRLHAVGGKKPNPWGLFDMHGNVLEWCGNWFGETLAGGDDPKGPSTGDLHVGRGGFWRDSADDCRSAARNFMPSLDSYWVPGFRVVRIEHPDSSSIFSTAGVLNSESLATAPLMPLRRR